MHVFGQCNSRSDFVSPSAIFCLKMLVNKAFLNVLITFLSGS